MVQGRTLFLNALLIAFVATMPSDALAAAKATGLSGYVANLWANFMRRDDLLAQTGRTLLRENIFDHAGWTLVNKFDGTFKIAKVTAGAAAVTGAVGYHVYKTYQEAELAREKAEQDLKHKRQNWLDECIRKIEQSEKDAAHHDLVVHYQNDLSGVHAQAARVHAQAERVAHENDRIRALNYELQQQIATSAMPTTNGASAGQSAGTNPFIQRSQQFAALARATQYKQKIDGLEKQVASLSAQLEQQIRLGADYALAATPQRDANRALADAARNVQTFSAPDMRLDVSWDENSDNRTLIAQQGLHPKLAVPVQVELDDDDWNDEGEHADTTVATPHAGASAAAAAGAGTGQNNLVTAGTRLADSLTDLHQSQAPMQRFANAAVQRAGISAAAAAGAGAGAGAAAAVAPADYPY